VSAGFAEASDVDRFEPRAEAASEREVAQVSIASAMTAATAFRSINITRTNASTPAATPTVARGIINGEPQDATGERIARGICFDRGDDG
jgi:hypothetical protein